MKSPQLLCGALAVLLLTTGACNRSDVKVDSEKAKDEAKVAAAQAKVVAGKASEQFADGWLTTKIQAQFFADQDIRARDIDVTTKDRIVTIRGRVQDENAHLQAVQTAKNTDGVKLVIDEMIVGPELPKASVSGAVATTGAAVSDVASKAIGLMDDARITSSIRSKFFLDDRVKVRHIDVDTRQGIVTLRGQVGSDFERSQALLLARTTDGVQRVEDNLSIDLALDPSLAAAGGVADHSGAPANEISQQFDDATITTKIQAKYFLDKDVKAGGMDITTKDGVVLLQGTVPSRVVKDRALMLARDTEGVVQVVDRLKVQQTAARPRKR